MCLYFRMKWALEEFGFFEKKLRSLFYKVFLDGVKYNTKLSGIYSYQLDIINLFWGNFDFMKHFVQSWLSALILDLRQRQQYEPFFLKSHLKKWLFVTLKRQPTWYKLIQVDAMWIKICFRWKAPWIAIK